MHHRNAHSTGFGIQAGREVAKGVDPAAGAVLRFQDHHVMALPGQLVARSQASHASADDDHSLLARRHPRRETLGRRGDHLGGNPSLRLRLRLDRFVSVTQDVTSQ